MKIHTLANGATVIVLSPGHGFKFSDGTVAMPQDKELCDKLTLERTFYEVKKIKGMSVNKCDMGLTTEQRVLLNYLCSQADIVLVPFMIISALYEQGVRSMYPNALAMNATTETMRSAPQDKIVDINNWSY